MNDHAADADGIRGVDDPPGRILEEGSAKAPPLVGVVATASRRATTTGMGFGMLRRNRPGALCALIALDARA